MDLIPANEHPANKHPKYRESYYKLEKIIKSIYITRCMAPICLDVPGYPYFTIIVTLWNNRTIKMETNIEEVSRCSYTNLKKIIKKLYNLSYEISHKQMSEHDCNFNLPYVDKNMSVKNGKYFSFFIMSSIVSSIEGYEI